MRKGIRKSVWIGCGLAVLSVVLWGPLALRVMAATVSVSQVRVTVCGDGVTEGAEQCDTGKRCQSTVSCAVDADCAGIGDALCKPRDYGSCTSTCTFIGARRQEPTQVTITDITVRPELRYLGSGNNYDTDFYFSVLNADNLNRQTLYQSPIPLSANTSGIASPYVTLPDAVVPGVYDVLLKSKAHLAKLQNNVYFQAGDNFLNFTNPDNGATIGSVTLTAGDIDGAGNSLSSYGDNVINAVDLSVLLSQIGTSDPSGNTIRANLNQDNIVDQADLNILVGNLDKVGDK